MDFPEDLLAQIKKYIKDNNEIYHTEKLFFFIDCTVTPPKLVFEKWLYKFPVPQISALKR